MSNPFTRVKPGNWAFGEILTAAQMNALDTDHAAASATTNCDAEQNRTGVQIPFGSGRPEGNNLTGWQISSLWLAQNDVSITGRWIIDLSAGLPHGVTVTQVQALAHGNAFAGASHGVSMPTMPFIEFTEQSSSGTINYDVSQADTSANAGAYEIDHQITLTVSRTVSRLAHYFVMVRGEIGGNALNTHFAVKGLSISWTAP